MAIKRTKKLNLLAIDIGSHSVKFATGQEQGGRVKVTALFNQPLPDQTYSNGAILDEVALKTAIRTALTQNGIKQKDVALTIESTEIIKREMLIPKVDAEDQMDLITYEVGQYLPIDIGSYVLQYKVIGNVQEEAVEKTKILLGAMPKDMVRSHFNLLTECGLNPVFMDMHSNSLEKLVQASAPGDQEATAQSIAYIDFGHSIIDITIVEGGQYKFNRLLKMGGSELDRILCNLFEMDAQEAEKLKKRTSAQTLLKAMPTALEEPEDMTTENGVKNRAVRETVHYLNDCIDEIDKVFKYYTSRSIDNKIDQIVLLGGSSEFKDLTGFFKERLDIPTNVVKRMSCLDLVTKNTTEELPKYINTLGALIRK